MSAEERLKAAIAQSRSEHDGVDLEPATAYEALTRQLLEDLATDVDQLGDRINGIIWLVAGAVIVGVILQVAGLD